MAEPDDDFDEIVRRLDLDLPFPQAPERPLSHPSKRRAQEEPVDFDDQPDDVSDQFYRQVSPTPPHAPHRRRTLGWLAVLGSPIAIIVCTFLHVWLPRPVLLGIGLIFVAGSVYLISQLPEHGPSRPDWPDDGAEL